MQFQNCIFKRFWVFGDFRSPAGFHDFEILRVSSNAGFRDLRVSSKVSFERLASACPLEQALANPSGGFTPLPRGPSPEQSRRQAPSQHVPCWVGSPKRFWSIHKGTEGILKHFVDSALFCPARSLVVEAKNRTEFAPSASRLLAGQKCKIAFVLCRERRCARREGSASAPTYVGASANPPWRGARAWGRNLPHHENP